MEEQEIKLLVGKRIKFFRKSLKMTQAELGEAININQRQITWIENGRSMPQLSTLVKLTKIFNCKIEDFYKSDSFTDKNDAISEIITVLTNCSLEQLSEIYSLTKNIKQKQVVNG